MIRKSNRELMELAISVMKQSIHESRQDKASPYVGAVLLMPDGNTIHTACRGEFREGDHAEYTLLDKKLRLENLDGATLFTTLEPCMERNSPKICCAKRIVNARIKDVWVGVTDPDPTVDRKGIKYLQDNGVKVNMFDRDLQMEINEVNKEFLNGALERARVVHEAESNVLNQIESPVLASKIDILDEVSLSQFMKMAGFEITIDSDDFKEYMTYTGICIKENRKMVPSGSGILLFGKNPGHMFKQSGLRAKLTYPNGEVEYKSFDGPMVSISANLEQWYKDKLPFLIDRSSAQRKESNPIPFEIVREAVVNALVHRDYSIEGAKCQLDVSLEKIVVKSPGRPVEPITMDQMRNLSAPQLSRNPLLHYVFRIMELAEEKNFGMDTWKSLPATYSLPLPIYTFEDPYLVLTVFSSAMSITAEVPNHILEKLNQNEKKGLEYLVSVKLISRLDYQMHFGYDARTAQRHLSKFVELGLVEKIGSGPRVKYKVIIDEIK